MQMLLAVKKSHDQGLIGTEASGDSNEDGHVLDSSASPNLLPQVCTHSTHTHAFMHAWIHTQTHTRAYAESPMLLPMLVTCEATRAGR